MQTPFDQRENNFDFIRMGLALLVIYSHSYLIGTGSTEVEPIHLLTRQQVTGGHVAVDLFFIISGFLTTASFERSSSVLNYVAKRVRRIYPAFIVVMALTALFVMPLAGGHLLGASGSTRAFNFITHILRLRDFDANQGLAGNPYSDFMNASLWSIPYEFSCYIGIAVLGVLGILRSRKLLVAMFVLSIGISFLFLIRGWYPTGGQVGRLIGTPSFWARLLPMYLAGVVFYRFRAHIPVKPPWVVAGCVLLVAAARVPNLWVPLFPLVGAYLILVLAFHPALRLHGWARFGDFSYGTYLYAFPIQQLIVHGVGHSLPAGELFMLATPPTLLCAVLSWHGVEKWFLPARPTVEPEPQYSIAFIKAVQR